MTGKIIRPAPAEIEFRNMRFLITDQPQVSPVTSARPLIGQGLSLVSDHCVQKCKEGRKYLLSGSLRKSGLGSAKNHHQSE